MACFYNLLLKPVSGEENEKHIISLSHLNSSALMRNLSFNSNYSLSFFSHVIEKETISSWCFVTPSCLHVTKENFSFCDPTLPKNMSIALFSEIGKAYLTWDQPSDSLKSDPIIGYYVSYGQIYSQLPTVTQHTTYLPGTSRNTVLSHLNSGSNYFFEVRAHYKRKIGSPGRIYLKTNDLQQLHLLTSDSYFYSSPVFLPIVIFSILLIFLIALLAIYRFYMTKNKTQSNVCMHSDLYEANRPFFIQMSQLSLIEVIGQGAFGVVYRGTFNRSQCDVAIKVIPNEFVTMKQFLNEIEILKTIGRHNNIIGMYGFSFGPKKMYLILQYCPYGDLHTYLVNLESKLMHLKDIPIAEQPKIDKTSLGVQLCSYIYQVAQGMEFISSLNLIHRDLATRNILLLNEKVVKIADFGLSKDVSETKNYLMRIQNKLPLKWMAPEAIEMKIFNTLTDVWSFGVLIWEVFMVGKEPYGHLENLNLLQYLKSGNRLQRPNCSENLYEIMSSCWLINPLERPLFQELVKKIGCVSDELSEYIVLS